MGDYDSYMYYINKEIEEGERETQNTKSASAPPAEKFTKGNKGSKGKESKAGPSQNEQRELRKKIKSIERKIAKLDEQRKELKSELLKVTDAELAMDLHNQVEEISQQLEAAEEQWLELN